MNIFSTSNFPSVSHVKQHWKTIRDEFLSVKDHAEKWPPKAFQGTIVDGPDGVVTNNNGQWDFLPLFIDGKWLVDKEFCPVTISVAEKIPNIFLVGFSILKGGCEIFPHSGPDNPAVFKYHLGLIASGKAWINVGGDVYYWNEGEDTVFDDTVEHFAFNPTDNDRVILMIDLIKT